jgi:polysaccharide deacetylase 2 family uncharacterized protein YibQ
VKKSLKKPETEAKNRWPRPKKRKSPKGPARKEGLQAVLFAGILISAAALISAGAVFIHTVVTGGNSTAVQDKLPDAGGSSGAPVSLLPPEDAGVKAPSGSPGPASKPASPEPASGPAVSVAKSGSQPEQTPAAKTPSQRDAPKTAPVSRTIKTPPAQEASKPEKSAAPSYEKIVPAAGVREQVPEPVPRRGGRLIFVIDDAGNNLRELEPFLRFPGPLTIAVLPGLPNSVEAARRIREAGKEVFLHQPMEALGGQDPGPGAVYSGMSPGEIRTIIEKNLAEIGPVAGLNNHQGSRITMDEKAMETVLALCAERGIYFLDSRTTADTAAPGTAKRLGIKIGERDVFLDNVQEKSSMIRSVEEGLVKAEKKGTAVMIGHTWSPELAPVLEELYPKLISEGYSFLTVSRFMAGGEVTEKVR